MPLDSSLRLKIAEAINRSAYAEAHAYISLHLNDLSSGQEFYWAAISYAFGSEDKEKAIELFDQALAAGYDAFWANFQKANCLLLLDRVSEAIDSMGLAHHANPVALTGDALFAILQETARNGLNKEFVQCVRTMVAVGVPLSASVHGVESNKATSLNSFVIKSSEYAISTEVYTEKLKSSVCEFEKIDDKFERSVLAFGPVNFANSVILNSVPKAGTHLLKNIIAHMIGLPHSNNFLDVYNFFDIWENSGENPVYYVGHLPFDLKIAKEIRNVKHLLLIRDPAQLIIAAAKAAFDPRIDRPDYRLIRSNFSLREYVVMLARGYQIDGVSVAPFDQFLKDFMGDWLCHDVAVVDFEAVIAMAKNPSSAKSQSSMEKIAGVFGFDLPTDWADRIRSASNPGLSATFLPPLVGENRKDDLRFASDVLAIYAPGGLAAYTALQKRTIFRNP
ncbi:hypothetical protein [Niveispirillum sp. BGYR6]|uniref:hypothetical protein n=1 Tax=Niveispirillum sp. BGYR6 TaxID=2971249 RepID=UPI0022B9AD50|nr:hypothetical protein [Niveispirillum sp. BGYR6]MDG5497432.1 hypothetical protein [Niveispirillum sp. BGYR6]